MAGVRKRPTKASYIDIGKDGTAKYVLMGTGFTELNESPAAQNASKKYINMYSATKSITSYDWSTPFSADQIPSEEAIDFICNIGENMLTGSDAEADYVMVDLDKTVGSVANTFQARMIRVAVAVSEFPDNDGEMGVSGDLLGVGDIVSGTFDTITKTFVGAGAVTLDATLSGLVMGSLTLAPIFDSGVTSYAATTTNATNTITATPTDSKATVEIKVGEAAVTNGAPATWVTGVNVVTVTVTNGDQTKVYTVTVTKETA